MCTSTPLPVNVTSQTSNQLSTPPITMKVSQLYNKSTMLLNDTTLYITPEQTPRMSPIGKSERLVRISKSLRAELAYETDSKDNFTTMKSPDEKLELDQKSQVSSKKINKSKLHSNEHIHNEGKSNSGTNSSSARTVIEKSSNKQNSIFILSPYSTDLSKTPTESKSSVKESSSKKSSKIRSFGSARHSIVNKIASSFGIPTTPNLPSTSRNASLKHDVRNSSSKMTPSTDRVSKKRNSIFEYLPPDDKRIEKSRRQVNLPLLNKWNPLKNIHDKIHHAANDILMSGNRGARTIPSSTLSRTKATMLKSSIK
ncbi:hypothetical protein DBV15_01069 [Temnothorax longispinosus]|uniref:Uncharacterized protein n=1 Tax=Temnothorax longispinosus TaxID=300112 RepID=A0A4V3S661_9HYME|nr:hypothetical protein DBV15_01069 [Temnothorax longispinosus]